MTTRRALRLPVRPPIAVAPLSRFLLAHTVPGLDLVAPDGTHLRAIAGLLGPAAVEVRLAEVPDDTTGVPVVLHLADDADAPAAVTAVRRWLDLDADPAREEATLAADPVLAPLLAARPGLRCPGALDGPESALLVVLGQHVSLRAACTAAGRLVAAYGGDGVVGLRTWPTPERLAETSAEQVRETAGLTGARARALVAVAQAVVDGLDLSPGADPAATRAALLALPGVGPWTAEMIAMRALGDRDALPAGDLVLRRAVALDRARDVERRAEGWRPARGLALHHLWTREVFA